MQDRKPKSNVVSAIGWIATGLIAASGIIGCQNYGGSVPLDDDAGIQGKHPKGAVDASVPIDDDAGAVKDKAPKP